MSEKKVWCKLDWYYYFFEFRWLGLVVMIPLNLSSLFQPLSIKRINWLIWLTTVLDGGSESGVVGYYNGERDLRVYRVNLERLKFRTCCSEIRRR
jgi:hypothetical protein